MKRFSGLVLGYREELVRRSFRRRPEGFLLRVRAAEVPAALLSFHYRIRKVYSGKMDPLKKPG
jgi:hypothetical protein